MEFKDYYSVLGVRRDASQDEIKRAYRKLARKYHPDVSREPDAEARFKDLGEAYEVLRDPERRAAYDRLGTHWRPGQEFHPPPDWDAGFEHSSGFAAGEGAAFSDFFESLFGVGPGAARRERAAFRARGQDRFARVMIDLEDAYRGAARPITLTTPELDQFGRLHTRTRTLNVQIPKGVRQGQHIRLAGQGEAGVGGAGDLYLEVAFRPHPVYRVEGRDVYLDLPIAPWEAALGATVELPAPGGRVDLKIPPGSGSGRKLRLRGLGIPGTPPGDLYAVLQVVVPPARTEQARALYRQMERDLKFNPRERLGA